MLLAGRENLQMLLKRIQLIRKKKKKEKKPPNPKLEVPSLNVQKVV